MDSKSRRRFKLTEQQRRMYAAEKADNFRWAASLLGTYSKRHLTSADEVPSEIQKEIAEIGQFSETVYTTLPIQFLLDHYTTLSQPGFPLEGYDALSDVVLLDSMIGDVAKLQASIFHRPTHNQIIVAIPGTSRIEHAIHDLRALRTKHPSHKGSVHSGFWGLYRGLEPHIKTRLCQSWEKLNATELVLTGHSMGGAISYLLAIDLLSSQSILPAGHTLKLVTFGSPRAADSDLVDHYHSLVDLFRQKHGEQAFIEYSVRGYNDGVPTLPPLMFGYRHFPKVPIYATGDQLYYVPFSEREHALFHIENRNDKEQKVPSFPRGGHNYYNGRELELLSRRLTWLDKAKIDEEKWQERYVTLSKKHS